MKLDLSVPGGPIRGDYPRQVSTTLTADNEADLARGVFVTLIDAYGFTRIARAVTGMFCELVNPVSPQLRMMVAEGVISGTGLEILQQDVTVCKDCGAEEKRGSIIDPNAEEGADVETYDETTHTTECEASGDDIWTTTPAVVIAHPARYAPLEAPGQETDEAPIISGDADEADEPDAGADAAVDGHLDRDEAAPAPADESC